jgi:hypothetical protein
MKRLLLVLYLVLVVSLVAQANEMFLFYLPVVNPHRSDGAWEVSSISSSERKSILYLEAIGVDVITLQATPEFFFMVEDTQMFIHYTVKYWEDGVSVTVSFVPKKFSINRSEFIQLQRTFIRFLVQCLCFQNETYKDYSNSNIELESEINKIISREVSKISYSLSERMIIEVERDMIYGWLGAYIFYEFNTEE